MRIFVLILFTCFTSFVIGQCIINTNIQHQSDINNSVPLFQHSMSVKRDSLPTKPFLYVAAKEQGLIIYNISNIALPVQVTSIATTSLQNLDVMNITQAGNYLYLALGDNFNATSQNSGMAIVDINNPAIPVLKSVYSYSAPSGSGHVSVDGNYAYLSAMQNGIIVLDVSNKSSIQFVSIYKPTINYPKNNPSPSEIQKINARSTVVKGNQLYLCNDAGGVRVIKATNKLNLVQTGKYYNSLLLNKARAYNNLILDDTLAYVAADYCGIEILNVKDTANISRIGWWNPWKCETSSNTWFNSPGYANEIELDKNCKLLFVSTGRSDLHAVSIANPLLPDSCQRYGTTTDSLGSWGLGRYNNQLYLSYISTWPLYIPFTSKWSGIKLLTYNNSCTLGINEFNTTKEIIFPNPTTGLIFIRDNNTTTRNFIIYNSLGSICKKGKFENQIDMREFPSGVYYLEISSNEQKQVLKFLKTN